LAEKVGSEKRMLETTIILPTGSITVKANTPERLREEIATIREAYRQR